MSRALICVCIVFATGLTANEASANNWAKLGRGIGRIVKKTARVVKKNPVKTAAILSVNPTAILGTATSPAVPAGAVILAGSTVYTTKCDKPTDPQDPNPNDRSIPICE